jgi:hypothetical protein
LFAWKWSLLVEIQRKKNIDQSTEVYEFVIVVHQGIRVAEKITKCRRRASQVTLRYLARLTKGERGPKIVLERVNVPMNLNWNRLNSRILRRTGHSNEALGEFAVRHDGCGTGRRREIEELSNKRIRHTVSEYAASRC